MELFMQFCRKACEAGSSLVFIWTAYNFFVCLIYGLDKNRARAKRGRISERTLKLLAFFFGGLGATVGMLAFRHKTRHLDFKIMIPFFLVIQVLLIGIVTFYGTRII